MHCAVDWCSQHLGSQGVSICLHYYYSVHSEVVKYVVEVRVRHLLHMDAGEDYWFAPRDGVCTRCRVGGTTTGQPQAYGEQQGIIMILTVYGGLFMTSRWNVSDRCRKWPDDADWVSQQNPQVSLDVDPCHTEFCQDHRSPAKTIGRQGSCKRLHFPATPALDWLSAWISPPEE